MTRHWIIYDITICLKHLQVLLSYYYNSSNLSRSTDPQSTCSTISKQKPPEKKFDSVSNRAILRARHIVSSMVADSVSSNTRHGHSPFGLPSLRKRTGKSPEPSHLKTASMASTLSCTLGKQDSCSCRSSSGHTTCNSLFIRTQRGTRAPRKVSERA